MKHITCNEDLDKKHPIMKSLKGFKSVKKVTYFQEATDMYEGETTLKVHGGKLLRFIETSFNLIELNFSEN